MIIRPIAPGDLDALFQIAVESGPGFTSLMPDRDALIRKIDHSVASFAKSVTHPGDEHYLFVLEDSATGEIMGTTGIEASAGLHRPLVHFRRSAVLHHLGEKVGEKVGEKLGEKPREKRKRQAEESLTRSQHYTGCTEVCSLYLRPGFRRPNAGKLLSRVRFLFMALHPERFSQTVIAEMRGVSDHAGQSPFWEWLKHQVADLDFMSATRLACCGHSGFIDKFIPSEPLYTRKMTDAARAVIGQVHVDTRPARHMLEREGFHHQGFVDLLDGGPTLECPRSEIASVRNTLMARALVPGAEADGTEATGPDNRFAIVANAGCADFRATVTDESFHEPDTGQMVVPERLASHLNLTNGTPVCCLPMGERIRQRLPDHQPAIEEIRYA